MSQQLDEPPIEPIYSQAHPNQPIDFGQVEVEFDLKGKTRRKTANARMRFMPDHRLEFACSLDGEPPTFVLQLFADDIKELRLALPSRGVSFDALLRSASGKDNTIVFEPRQSGVTVTTASQAIVTTTFHLFNFPDFRGSENYVLLTGEPPLQGAKSCGRVTLRADGWLITIAATEQTDDLAKELNVQGGYVLTHVGRIVRDDGSAFTSGQLDDLLTCLQYFLSFALGRWAGVALPVGVDAEGRRIFEQWGLRITADGPWNGSSSWFDEHHGESLSEVFPGFVSLWKNALWREPLTHALYWYLGANDRRVGIGVDTGLILAQTALELIAWTYCVRDRKIVKPKKFRRGGLSASDKLRLLVSDMGIHTGIPDSLAVLHGEIGKSWNDGLEAITAIRNSLVHPDGRISLPNGAYFEGWKLSLWYIDLALLRLCGHGGNYANRLTERWVGQVESVPWA